MQAAPLDDLLELFEVAALGHADADPLRDRRRSQRFAHAHSRMLPGVHSSSRFLIALRNWPAIMPSMIRWSKLRHMFIMWRIAIASSTTTARLTIDSVVRIAACGWVMISWPAIEPVPPLFFKVNLPPCTSSRV